MALSSYSGVPLVNTVWNPSATSSDTGAGTVQGNYTTSPTVAGNELSQFGGLDTGLFGMGNQGIAAQAGLLGAASSTAGNLRGLGNTLSNEFSGNAAYANQALTNAFDPQQALYNQYLGQITDQTNSQEALRGIANTPYGAAVTGNTLGQFNTGWNAQQIQNENVGANTAAALQGQESTAQTEGGQLISAAGNLDVAAAQQTLQGYGLQGQDAAAALQDLVSMFSAQSVSLKA
jgi:hypothetical protein